MPLITVDKGLSTLKRLSRSAHIPSTYSIKPFKFNTLSHALLLVTIFCDNCKKAHTKWHFQSDGVYSTQINFNNYLFFQVENDDVRVREKL